MDNLNKLIKKSLINFIKNLMNKYQDKYLFSFLNGICEYLYYDNIFKCEIYKINYNKHLTEIVYNIKLTLIRYNEEININIYDLNYMLINYTYYFKVNNIIEKIFLNLYDLYKIKEKKDKKINQCIAICKILNKSSFKRPFNLTEDIMNCY